MAKITLPTRSAVVTKKSGDPRFTMENDQSYACEWTNLMPLSEQYHAVWANETLSLCFAPLLVCSGELLKIRAKNEIGKKLHQIKPKYWT